MQELWFCTTVKGSLGMTYGYVDVFFFRVVETFF